MTFILVLFIVSCGQRIDNETNSVNQCVIDLNNRALEVASYNDKDSIKLAIVLLDSAIEIQPEHFYSHYNLLIFQNELGLTKEAAKTSEEVSKLRPKNPILLMNSVILNEFIGDTTFAHNTYLQSKSLFEYVFDSIQGKSDYYKILQYFYAIDLRLLNHNNKSDSVFKIICQDTTESFKYYSQKHKDILI